VGNAGKVVKVAEKKKKYFCEHILGGRELLLHWLDTVLQPYH